jgi:hypothetical protein
MEKAMLTEKEIEEAKEWILDCQFKRNCNE